MCVKSTKTSQVSKKTKISPLAGYIVSKQSWAYITSRIERVTRSSENRASENRASEKGLISRKHRVSSKICNFQFTVSSIRKFMEVRKCNVSVMLEQYIRTKPLFEYIVNHRDEHTVLRFKLLL